MAKNKSRSAMDEDLNSRTEKAYQSREGEKTFFGAFKRDENFPQWYADKGEHELDIIPYKAGSQDPKAQEGAFNYVCDYLAHRNVGPRELWFLCLDQYNKACPICEHRNELRKNPPTGSRAIKDHDEEVKALRPKRRVIYNVVVYDNNEQQEKGVQVWEASHYLTEANIMDAAKLPKKRGGGLITFAHPDADKGHTVIFERTGENENTRYKRFSLEPRDYDIEDNLLDACFTLDELLHMPTYEEIRDAFWDRGSDEDEEEEEPRRSRGRQDEDEEAEEELTPTPHRRKAKARDDNEDPEEPRRGRRSKATKDKGEDKCPVPGGVFGKDADDFDECEDCDFWRSCVKASIEAKNEPQDEDEEAEERASKRQGRRPKIEVADDDGDEESADPERDAAGSDDATGEDDPAPRKRNKPQRVAASEDEDPPPRRGRGPRKFVEDDIPF